MPLNKLKIKQKPRRLDLSNQIFKFEAIGTVWCITIERPISKTKSAGMLKDIKSRIDKFDLDYSRFRSDSLISSMAKEAGKYKLPGDAEVLFDLYEKLYKLSNGLMTPLIGQLLSDAGYDSDYSLKPGKLGLTPKWDKAIDYQFPYLLVKEPVLIDVGAAGKGYLVDIIAELIQENGIKQFCINAGGDILNRNVSSDLSRVGLEHPLQLDEVIGIADVVNKSICGSAPNRRTWSNFSHIINPSTKESPKDLLATWVIADTTILADGLATALFFIEPSKLQLYYNFEYAIVKNDLSLLKSANFPAEFFTKPDGAKK